MRQPDSGPRTGPASAQTNAIARRQFAAWLGGMLALSACGRTPQSVLESLPSGAGDSSSSQLVNVRDFGAIGDGITDDTQAINAAINSLNGSGGIVSVPDGIYMIDALTSVQLVSGVSLTLATNATLRAIPTSSGKYAVVLLNNVSNASVIGGRILGERDNHLGGGGEWGMGIKIVGSSNVAVDGVETSDCWGDGIYIGALGIEHESTNVTLKNCKAANNRRQGISITGCVGGLIDNCTLTGTNGTAPSAGVDLEPNGRVRVSDIVVRNCIVAGNAGDGILLAGRTVTNIRLESNRTTQNGGSGIFLVDGASGVEILENRVDGNGEHGVLFRNAHYSEIASNVIRDNGAGRTEFFNVRLKERSSHNTLADNRFGVSRLIDGGAPDVVIDSDCTDNITTIPPSPATRPQHRG